MFAAVELVLLLAVVGVVVLILLGISVVFSIFISLPLKRKIFVNPLGNRLDKTSLTVSFLDLLSSVFRTGAVARVDASSISNCMYPCPFVGRCVVLLSSLEL